jgi:hypothetical protein
MSRLNRLRRTILEEPLKGLMGEVLYHRSQCNRLGYTRKEQIAFLPLRHFRADSVELARGGVGVRQR